MAPTSTLWEHASESATPVAPALRKTVSRGADGETPRKRRSARIAAIRTRAVLRSQAQTALEAYTVLRARSKACEQREAGSHRPQPEPQGTARTTPAPPTPPLQRSPQMESGRLSPAPADTAASAEAAAAECARARHASLAHVLWRTLVLMHSNRLLALQVEALKRETSAFVCSVLSNPQNHALLPPAPSSPAKQQQQPASP
ncbi:uncharacterized protein LOC126298634 [Schistocerca gregaria]|uniref:uncharacterized protein LOC126298634 n=1 Tax=Schistocerca gregaria TaxID=7010 RepID=UPI00211EBC2A|nr:uncharacterized protein LOC126298634 [Schistocerca gregaria]